MKISILKELRPGETRVAASPETVKKFIDLGFNISIEKNAGACASFSDAEYRAAGASIGASAAATIRGADIVLKVQRPMIAGEKKNELAAFTKGQILICQMNALTESKFILAMAKAGITGYAMELMPRITRAQSMDILSSQSNLAGYKAVLDSTIHYSRALPMMMTAAGTVPPARIFVMGVGVAGLQAIATARRLGSIVTATDVRPATKEQVESLGGKFIAVENQEFRKAQTAGGYAKEMSADYKRKQSRLISDHITKQDIVICTALIPGRPAPKLVSNSMLKIMKPGSVVIDLAVEAGGNCAGSKLGKIVKYNGVTIVGYDNVPGRLPEEASKLFSRNLFNFLTPFFDKKLSKIVFDPKDEIIEGIKVTENGAVVHPTLKRKISRKSSSGKTSSNVKRKKTVKAAKQRTISKRQVRRSKKSVKGA